MIASSILFLVDSGMSELFIGMTVVLLNESWVAGKLSDFSTDAKPGF